ncbi:MAG TPA: CidA/LrgA family protein [Bradyrhizobium sp.]|jgi:holin-like protein|nr:CidA/LrgA family protein [Bradyrhizobium sp.]
MGLDLAILLMFQFAGEMMRAVTGLPVPGPVIGMVLLLVALLAKLPVPAGIHATSRKLLAYLGLLFVPAGAGVVTRLPMIGAHWLPIVIAVVGSTIITMVITAVVMRGLERLGTVNWRAIGFRKPSPSAEGST